ncbi:hypothetical protein BdWA1_002436 [Babesia duncani]|uniref:Uncharacterized protein n=1 Tax=Babesia duncani TaxID=323732 RepID=A0AAD9PHH0_9APIC|nr:hypothetical protein BdWA1_003772 [Babesia duncani]KAK2195840.1 hypothetical protein BdWA1_002436 [Babesia duncani]
MSAYNSVISSHRNFLSFRQCFYTLVALLSIEINCYNTLSKEIGVNPKIIDIEVPPPVNIVEVELEDEQKKKKQTVQIETPKYNTENEEKIRELSKQLKVLQKELDMIHQGNFGALFSEYGISHDLLKHITFAAVAGLFCSIYHTPVYLLRYHFPGYSKVESWFSTIIAKLWLYWGRFKQPIYKYIKFLIVKIFAIVLRLMEFFKYTHVSLYKKNAEVVEVLGEFFKKHQADMVPKIIFSNGYLNWIMYWLNRTNIFRKFQEFKIAFKQFNVTIYKNHGPLYLLCLKGYRGAMYFYSKISLVALVAICWAMHCVVGGLCENEYNLVIERVSEIFKATNSNLSNYRISTYFNYVLDFMKFWLDVVIKYAVKTKLPFASHIPHDFNHACVFMLFIFATMVAQLLIINGLMRFVWFFLRYMTRRKQARRQNTVSSFYQGSFIKYAMDTIWKRPNGAKERSNSVASDAADGKHWGCQSQPSSSSSSRTTSCRGDYQEYNNRLYSDGARKINHHKSHVKSN